MRGKFFWIIIIVAVAAGFYYKDKLKPKTETVPTKQEQVKPGNNNDDDNSNRQEPENTFEGTLKVSNDKKRGNIMLELADSDRVIYMSTSRDFSAFYGKEVVVSIDGDLNGFKLLDIKAK